MTNQSKIALSILVFSLASLVAGTVGGVWIGRAVYDWNGMPSDKYPAEMTFSEKHDAPFITQTTEPLSMELVIEEKQAFEKETFKTYGLHTVQGYAMIGRNICRIVVPSGWVIDAVPEDSHAWWNNPEDGNYLAHEILHCLRGEWHPEVKQH